MRKILGCLGWWLVRRYADTLPIQSIPLPVMDAARAEIEREGRDAEANGELRRHRAYARLLKQFPDAPRRQIGLAIELAVAELPE